MKRNFRTFASLIFCIVLSDMLPASDHVNTSLENEQRSFVSREAKIIAGIYEYAEWERKDLIRANLSGLDLSFHLLPEANLSKAILRKTNLHFAKLNGANLRGADLRGANLTGANLRDADLRGALIDEHTIFTLANFCGCNLDKLDLKGINLVRIQYHEKERSHEATECCHFVDPKRLWEMGAIIDEKLLEKKTKNSLSRTAGEALYKMQQKVNRNSDKKTKTHRSVSEPRQKVEIEPSSPESPQQKTMNRSSSGRNLARSSKTLSRKNSFYIPTEDTLASPGSINSPGSIKVIKIKPRKSLIGLFDATVEEKTDEHGVDK